MASATNSFGEEYADAGTPGCKRFASDRDQGYHQDMAEAKKFDFEAPIPRIDEEDEETLAAIDDGIRDAESGRTVPAKDVRRLVTQWTSASSTPKKR
jgi:predicted transcriptional regulator